ncbi:hypothetical protein [Streptomyces sp. NPDC048473]|uniref:hypothetical protein n=1 Tax=unclassified Streptomyces TaxID=2593676 RepID=UPI00371F2A24
MRGTSGAPDPDVRRAHPACLRVLDRAVTLRRVRSAGCVPMEVHAPVTVQPVAA